VHLAACASACCTCRRSRVTRSAWLRLCLALRHMLRNTTFTLSFRRTPEAFCHSERGGTSACEMGVYLCDQCTCICICIWQGHPLCSRCKARCHAQVKRVSKIMLSRRRALLCFISIEGARKFPILFFVVEMDLLPARRLRLSDKSCLSSPVPARWPRARASTCIRR
jgi:hypothetical protein